MQAVLLDDLRVQIDRNAAEISGCCEEELRKEISTIWDMDMSSVFTKEHWNISR